MTRYRRTHIEVNLSAIAHNIREHRRFIPDHADIMAVVKADGYGHGAVHVLEAAIEEGVNWAGVALVEEAVEIRKAGIDIPILLLGGWYPEALPAFYKYRITPAIFSMQSAVELNGFARERNQPIDVHLKVNTGMGRLGFSEGQLVEFLQNSQLYDYLAINGVFSHFSTADEGDHTFSLAQLEKFHWLVEIVGQRFRPKWLHIANSAGTSQLRQERGNLFRLGISMYGQIPSMDMACAPDLHEAIAWKSSIVQLQWYPAGTPISYGRTYFTTGKSLIATICVGYADGYSRWLSNNACVLVRGQRAPVVGRVCMDMIMVDVTSISNVQLWDEVVLIGIQDGERISATEMAGWIHTINYEVTCNISKRVPRNYFQD